MARNRPGRRNRGPGHRGPPFPAVFLAGLPRTCKEDDVRRFLSELDLVEILFKRIRGRFTGLAYCKLEESDEVSIALQQHRQKIGRHVVRVKPCKEQVYRRVLAQARRFVYTPILKMQGLPSSVKKSDIIDFFPDFHLTKRRVQLGPNGLAFVTFLTHDECQASLDLNGVPLLGCPVELSPSHRQEKADAGTTIGMEVATGATENAGAAAAGAWFA
ncbi:hypothetical protein LUZ61_009149 [Rhynchospora tenuis]|uniref:RRM domain-containing protein n=1 Tax=Rhynchospora tenuis TaxID=198213 RepID=A0AAD6EY62_9POAL|nr:hypothetical protein LUZ61_009149 [Rhynchospora tenuis]